MVLFAKASGWPLDSYWHPDHPVQRLALETVSAVSDVPIEEIETAVDGCGVITFGMPIRGLAVAFARLADPSAVADPPLRGALTRIRDAMMAHPELVAGERRRIDTALMRDYPSRIVSKGGAEGVLAMGLPPGALTAPGPFGDAPMGIAAKVEDGNLARRAGDSPRRTAAPAPAGRGRARAGSEGSRRTTRRGAGGPPRPGRTRPARRSPRARASPARPTRRGRREAPPRRAAPRRTRRGRAPPRRARTRPPSRRAGAIRGRAG